MKVPALFNDKNFYRNLFAVSLPIMLQNLINSFVNILDTVMIGRLGTVEIAAVGLGNNVFFFYSMILFGIGSGAAIFTAQYWGRQDIPGIRKNTGFCLLLNLSGALVFTLLCLFFPENIMRIYSRDPAVIAAGAVYLRILTGSFIPFAISQVFILTLRSVEKVRLAMVTTFIALSINAVLNYCFIFGVGPFPAMGIAGAALATVISRIAEMIVLLAVSYAKKYPPAGGFRELMAFNSPFVSRFIKIVLPVVINEFVWALGVSLTNIIFARTHTDAVAAYNITNTVSQLTWVLFIGLGNGVAVLIGKKIGEGDEKTARDYASRIVRFAPIVATGAIFILVPLSALFPFIFNVNEQVLVAARIMIIILGISYPFRAFNMTMVVGVCRAGGDTIFCTFYDVGFMWLIALPLAASAAYFFHAPFWAIYVCMSLDDLFKMFLGLWRYRSGKWLHNVIN
ncbi:MAG: MATE family efflux transporter [Treponema sp.]|jgi:putative MATE family efflux protein|nr:MATE family efflux transporter [Treponema sp.]